MAYKFQRAFFGLFDKSLHNVRSDLTGLYSKVEPCVKQLELDIKNYSILIDKADDDGVIDMEDIIELKKALEGACILKCMLVKAEHFKETGEVNVLEKDKEAMASIDLAKCEAIKMADLCEEVVEMAICIAKLFRARKS